MTTIIPSRLSPRARPAVMAALTAVLLSCGSPDTPTSATSTETPVNAVEIFTGQLTPGGSAFYSFQANRSDNGSYTFASLTNASTGRALDVVMTLGVGVPAGEDCAVSSQIDARPGLAPQLSSSLTIGTSCVRLWDPGNLTTQANFAVRIQHP